MSFSDKTFSCINICYTFNRTYLEYAAVSITSLLENNKNNNLIFHIIYDNIPQKEINIIDKLIKSYNSNVVFYNVNKNDYLFCPIKWKDRLSHAAYYRINLSNILPEEIKKVLYLDPDTIVTGDLAALYNTNIENSPMGVVLIDDGYFNSGVVLFNLEYFRENNLPPRIFEYIKDYKNLIKFYDQDAFNVILKNMWVLLPPKYNAGFNTIRFMLNMKKCPYTKEEIEEAIHTPAIIHYAGSFHYKPWYRNCIHPYQDEYLKYLNISPFKSSKLKTHYMLDMMQAYNISYEELTDIIKKQVKILINNKNIFVSKLFNLLYINKFFRNTLFNILIKIMLLKQFLNCPKKIRDNERNKEKQCNEVRITKPASELCKDGEPACKTERNFGTANLKGEHLNGDGSQKADVHISKSATRN